MKSELKIRWKLFTIGLVALAINCESTGGNSLPFFLMLGSGGANVASADAEVIAATDSNGIVLPVASSSISQSDFATVTVTTNNTTTQVEAPANIAVQEIPTKGNATVIGTVRPVVSGLESGDVCGEIGAPAAPNCIDLTRINVRIEVARGNESVLLASSYLNAAGSFVINLDDLPNNQYRLLINSANGLNYTYQDFSFVFNPTQTPRNLIQIPSLLAERLYYQSGPAILSGTVTTPGFSGSGTVVPSGAISNVTVKLLKPNGTLVTSTTTNSSGNFEFQIPNLPNGNYSIVYQGSSVQASGRPYAVLTDSFPFHFQGTNPSNPTSLTFGETSLPWEAATISSLVLSGSLSNGAVSGDSSSSFTVKLKNEQGVVLQSTTITGASSFQLSADGVPNGVYFVEVSSPSFATVSQSFLFTADPSGGTKNFQISAPVVAIPKPSSIVGFVRDAQGIHIPGSVINFRPDSSQPPSNLAYLLSDPQLGNAIRAWIVQALSGKAGKDCSQIANVSDPICSCALSPSASCLTSVQGSAPWSYTSYGNKVYEVRPSDNQVSFIAASGRWAYYISAPGYENFCGTNASPCAANPVPISLNGQDFNAGTISMVAVTKRSQIAGTIAVRDSGISPTTVHTSHSGLFLILLGNADENGAPVAHVTTSQAGAFSFGANSFVVSLPPQLTTDTQRVGFVLQELAQGRASLLSQAPTVARANDATAPIDIRNGSEFNFKQSSYQIIVVDRTSAVSYLAPTTLQADTSSVARLDYAATPALLQIAGIAVHSPRGSITGSVTDAISTSLVAGATLTLGRFDANGNFTADVRRDCGGAFSSSTCTVSSNRSPGSDQVVGSVTSSANGSFSIPFVSAGSYSLRVVANGITTFFPVEVSASGGTVSLNTPIITNPGRGNLAGSVRIPGGFAFTGSYSLEVVSPISDSIRPTAGVLPSSLTSGTTTFNNASQYSLFGINAGRWRVRFTSSGFKSVEGIVDIQADATTSFDIITFIQGSPPPAPVSGGTLSALTNTNVCNLTVRLRPGVNVKSGPFAIDANGVTLPAVTTANDGSFVIPNVPPGNYTLEASGTAGRDRACTGTAFAYSATYGTVISAGSNTPANQNILVSPIIPNNEMRIVLSWGASPRDIDSHLQFGTNPNGQDRVVYNQKSRLNGDALLDIDVTRGFGPETITLKGSVWTQPVRYYSIFNWSNERTLGLSSATVRVFRGSLGEVRNYAVNSNLTNRWWEVFCIGSDQSLTDVGTGNCLASNFIRRTSF